LEVYSEVAKRLLILGPSFRRNKTNDPLPALDRYDGVFFRVARKYLEKVKDVDVVVMRDDLLLVDGEALMPYIPPAGDVWGRQYFSKEELGKAREKNEDFLDKKLRNRRYSEIFIAMGKKHREALPDLSGYNVRVIFPTHGGPGPKARALREWIIRGCVSER